ncbi:hypothetical protein FQN54_003791 [Arachnomyces sp. PD_36]|nr:hypothetical protein FQN54_003791 [Arachnomyces sp. PD_36]
MKSDALSETSPLLGEQGNGDADASGRFEGNGTLKSNGIVTHREEESGKSDDEEDAGRVAQYEGLPEAQKLLKFIVPAVSVGVFLSAIDQTIIVASYARIGSDLNALNLTSWVATSYFLTLTSFQPLYGRLSDIFGRKPCLLFGYAVFGIGSVGCGLSRNMNELIASRVFQGIGGGGMTTVVNILLSDIVPLRDRGVWQGIINIVYTLGAGIGAPLGGFFADYIGWRWAFLVQGPICLIAIIAVSLALNLPARDESHWKTKLRRIDFLGAIILVAAVSTLCLGMDRGSNVSWTKPITIVSLCLSFVFFIAFMYVEVYVANEPFAPGYIIFDRSLFACFACNFFAFGTWMSVLFYAPLFFQAVEGDSATGAGVRLLPSIIAGVTGSLGSGFLMRRTGKYFWITLWSYALMVVGVLILFLCSGIAVTSSPGLIVGLTLGAFGNGVGVTTTLIGLIANAGPEDQAVATACCYLFRSLGSVLGLSLSGTVVQQTLRTGLRNALEGGEDADKIVERVRESLEYIWTLKPALQHVIRECYETAINRGFGFLLAVVVFTVVSSAYVREKKLSK